MHHANNDMQEVIEKVTITVVSVVSGWFGGTWFLQTLNHTVYGFVDYIIELLVKGSIAGFSAIVAYLAVYFMKKILKH